MTTPDEHTRAVLRTGDFLRKLTLAPEASAVTKTARNAARSLLLLYPGASDMFLAHIAYLHGSARCPSCYPMAPIWTRCECSSPRFEN